MIGPPLPVDHSRADDEQKQVLNQAWPADRVRGKIIEVDGIPPF
jgi:hypothetical protein